MTFGQDVYDRVLTDQEIQALLVAVRRAVDLSSEISDGAIACAGDVWGETTAETARWHCASNGFDEARRTRYEKARGATSG
jgi:hypothetical protein